MPLQKASSHVLSPNKALLANHPTKVQAKTKIAKKASSHVLSHTLSMELQLNQWRSNESEQQQQPSAKFPRLPQHEQSHSEALPFFLSEHNTRISSGLSDNNPPFRFPRMGSRFSLGQLQELELQALIYRYMVAGAAVPPELLQPIKRSLLHSPSYLLHHPLQHLEPSRVWGRAGIELEPRRCRRTDGKKWRCARDVVAGHKYCDRHVHRGRSRSRKPVESTPNVTSRATFSVAADASRFGFSGSSDSSTIQLLQLNNSPLDSKPEHKSHFQIPDGVDRSDGHILRPFFDDWPRPQKTDYNSGSKTDTMNSKNLSSDVSLKLCTGIGDELLLGDSRRVPPPQLGWGEGWAVNRVASMGGPLAEALRSSTSSSPTSVLHQMARGSASETSYVSA